MFGGQFQFYLTNGQHHQVPKSREILEMGIMKKFVGWESFILTKIRKHSTFFITFKAPLSLLYISIQLLASL